MNYFIDMIYLTDHGGEGYDGADEYDGTLFQFPAASRPPPELPAPAPPFELDNDYGSIMPYKPQPLINLHPPPPPRAESTPLRLDGRVYEPRIHPFNCTCGCKITEENDMLTSVYRRSQKRKEAYKKSKKTKKVDQGEGGWVYRKKKQGGTSQTSEYRRAQQRKKASNSKKKKQVDQEGGEEVYRKKKITCISQTSEYRKVLKRKEVYKSKKATKETKKKVVVDL